MLALPRLPLRVAALGLALLARPAAAQSPTPSWTRGSTCYEVFVRSFQDSDGDGIGDLRGLIAKLDYINDGDARSMRDLGARCIWLMPVAESPSYHGYDVTDYYRIEPDYGTNEDFKRLVAEAHRRGIRVIVDMVINHTSNQYAPFQAALRDTASPYRQWYRFASSRGEPNRWGNYNWHKSPVRDEWYYGFFWSGMPDLNYENPAALEEMKKVATFWLKDMDVDGLRLDAIRHLVEEGTRTENVPATHEVLRQYGAHIRATKPDAWTVGEVMDNNDVLLAYYPDQLDAHFAFEIADTIISAVRAGTATGLLAPVVRMQSALRPHQYAPFLRNHDQPRTRSELGGDMRKSRLATFVLLTLPGVPFVYYGEEIGMLGEKPDERLRTPMQWTRAPGAGFTTARPWQQMQSDSATNTVADHEADPKSILNLHRRMIHLRAASPALGGGELIPLTTSSEAVAAWLRRDPTQTVVVIANLGAAPLSNVTIAAPAGTIMTGNPAPRNLLGGAAAWRLRPRADGSVEGWVPVRTLAPMEGYVFEVAGAERR